jgi:DNA primase
MQNATDTIKERLSVSDVIGSYIKLEKTGANWKARCPFHNEKTPSFFVSGTRGSYYCFGCGAKGDIFSFVQAYEGLDFKGALKLLADRAGVSLSTYQKENTDEKEKLFAVMEEATKYYIAQLSKNPAALTYLKDRGLTDETIASFRIGFAPDDWRPLSDELAKKKFALQILEKAGLIKSNERGGHYDRFRNRVMFPIFDSTGRVIAFSGRTMSSDENTPKYLNSPDTPLFDKSAALYGIDRAKEFIRKKDYAIIVEGQFDLLLSHQAGILNTVAASGTALSDSVPSGDRGVTNLQMLARFSKNILFAFDGDKAGINAAYRGSLLALGLGMDVKVANLPEGKDPADLIKENKDGWLAILKRTESAISFFTKRIMDTKEERDRIKLVQKLILPMIAKAPSALLKEHFTKTVSEITGMSEDALSSDVESFEKENKERVVVSTEQAEKTIHTFSLADRLFGILFWQKGMQTPYVVPSVLEEKLKNAIGAERMLSLSDMAAERKEELIFEAEASYNDGGQLEQEFDRLLHELQARELKRDIEELAKKIREGERTGADMGEALMQVRDKTKQLEAIQSEFKNT